ncbi:MAG: class I SAM-dependent methyltransferase [Williamsia sp.]|nr:class I SAM-dependent methyltransferase [Williamsia sp.]
MPTYNRRAFVPHAIRYFLQQDYENKELIIIDDGADCIGDLVPDHSQIRYFYLEKKITLGAKLNFGCREAVGNILLHWDDDDWYAPRRIRYQVEELQGSDTDICGINHLLYYDLGSRQAFQYIYPANQRVWLLGSSLCYKRELWNSHCFDDIDVGMDGLFVWATPPERVRVLPDISMSVHMIHGKNISPKRTNGSWWYNYPVENLRLIMQEDWQVYKEGLPAPAPKGGQPVVKRTPAAGPRQKLQNVYACLVHEQSDCIMDLVRNLHYHDPASIILLYNGSEDPGLLKGDFQFDKWGAVIVPDPVAVKHGYLHPFALHCMAFALQNFSFDLLTIVDSDQLAIRNGYTAYLSSYLSTRPRIGMLSSKPERVTPADKGNYVALQAFKEYELWKPFLKNFPDGENRFVHWTFWPSTVFIFPAIKDLVELYSKSRQLQEIMAQSKIWASEEVILPTLVRLLGYEIAANPCSYDFIQYRKHYTPADISIALHQSNAFWIHPVPRDGQNPIRKMIREQANQYTPTIAEVVAASSPIDVSHAALISRIKKIKGWLSDGEAVLLINTTNKLCSELPPPHTVVEIGSYHGKSTVLFGSILQAKAPGSKVYAIDPHDGRLGAVDQGLQSFPPSFEAFKRNIEHAGLLDVVKIVKDKSYNIKCDLPVSLLFIDGLHDYLNVSRDFRHFADWIVPGGWVAFHDYAPYFPGVTSFVDELIKSGSYKLANKAETLIVLQRSTH